MNLNRLDEAADYRRGGILLLKLSGTDRSDKEITVVVHIDKIVVVSGDLDFPNQHTIVNVGEPLNCVLVVPADGSFPCGRRLRGDVVRAARRMES